MRVAARRAQQEVPAGRAQVVFLWKVWDESKGIRPKP